MAITCRECNIIQSFPVSSVMVAENIRNELSKLVGEEKIHVSYWVLTEAGKKDGTLEFNIGSLNDTDLHAFIVKYAGIIKQLHPRACEMVEQYYTGEEVVSDNKPEPVHYKTAEQVANGYEADGSHWYDLTFGGPFTKYYIRNFWKSEKATVGDFVKVRD